MESKENEVTKETEKTRKSLFRFLDPSNDEVYEVSAANEERALLRLVYERAMLGEYVPTAYMRVSDRGLVPVPTDQPMRVLDLYRAAWHNLYVPSAGVVEMEGGE